MKDNYKKLSSYLFTDLVVKIVSRMNTLSNITNAAATQKAKSQESREYRGITNGKPLKY